MQDGMLNKTETPPEETGGVNLWKLSGNRFKFLGDAPVKFAVPVSLVQKLISVRIISTDSMVFIGAIFCIVAGFGYGQAAFVIGVKIILGELARAGVTVSFADIGGFLNQLTCFVVCKFPVGKQFITAVITGGFYFFSSS
jgi:hypothetical protein